MAVCPKCKSNNIERFTPHGLACSDCGYDGRSSEFGVPSDTRTPSSDPEGGARGEADALHHLGNVLTILAELHPDDRSNALDGALAFYNARCPNAQVEPVAGVSRLVHQWPGPSDQLSKTPSADHDDGNLRATGGEE